MKLSSIDFKSTLLVFISASVLVACGGGGSTTADSPDEPEVTTQNKPDNDNDNDNDNASSPATPIPNTAGVTGKTLWTNHCVSCHGGDYGKGRSGNSTMSAIASNKGGMGALNGVVSLDMANQIAVFTASPGSY